MTEISCETCMFEKRDASVRPCKTCSHESGALKYWQPRPAAAHANPEGWIEWHGGECPVDEDAEVEVVIGTGVATTPRLANVWRWSWLFNGKYGDIVRYRVINPSSEPATTPEPPREYDCRNCAHKDLSGFAYPCKNCFDEDTKDGKPTNWQPITVTTPSASAFSTQVGGSHYNAMAIQPAEYIHRNGIGFMEGSSIAYLSRWKNKNGVEDLRKAVHTILQLIEMEEGAEK